MQADPELHDTRKVAIFHGFALPLRTNVAYNPNILKDALQARQLTTEQLSDRLGMNPTELNRELHRDPEPTPKRLAS